MSTIEWVAKAGGQVPRDESGKLDPNRYNGGKWTFPMEDGTGYVFITWAEETFYDKDSQTRFSIVLEENGACMRGEEGAPRLAENKVRQKAVHDIIENDKCFRIILRKGKKVENKAPTKLKTDFAFTGNEIVKTENGVYAAIITGKLPLKPLAS